MLTDHLQQLALEQRENVIWQQVFDRKCLPALANWLVLLWLDTHTNVASHGWIWGVFRSTVQVRGQIGLRVTHFVVKL